MTMDGGGSSLTPLTRTLTTGMAMKETGTPTTSLTRTTSLSPSSFSARRGLLPSRVELDLDLPLPVIPLCEGDDGTCTCRAVTETAEGVVQLRACTGSWKGTQAQEKEEGQKPVMRPTMAVVTGPDEMTGCGPSSSSSSQVGNIAGVVNKMLPALGRRHISSSALFTSLLAQLLYADSVSAEPDGVVSRDNRQSTVQGSENCGRFSGVPVLGPFICGEGQPPYFRLSLLSLCITSLFLTLQGRRGKIRQRLGNAGLVLFIMTLFISTSYLLWATLLPGLAWGVLEHNGRQVASQTAVGPDHPVFTVPASADIGKNIIPNIVDPLAVDPQTVCPGYLATNVQHSLNGFRADLTLAGPPCNVYGNDIESLTLDVTFQAEDRIRLQILPKYIGKDNETFFTLPEQLVPRPADELGAQEYNNKMEVAWSNDATFGFTIQRKDTKDILFTTMGNKLVFEDQFIEFKNSLPENYNLYGLGEVIHGFRLGNNLTRTLFAADVGDNIDANIYGSHPIYLDTRYFSKASGELEYVPEATDKNAEYVSYTHGVYLRNAHAQEILLRPEGVTWRALGGNIDLYFYNGPTATDVILAYQHSAVGLPAMQQYWTLGYHQCRWGYENWTVMQEVVDNFAKFEIPLETIWADIDYMKGYRDFENDPVRFSYKEGAEFLKKLHANGQHWVPIVDSAIYAPNPENASDAYPTYDRGVAANAFMMNPDGTPYIGAVWPGYTVFPDWVGAVLNGSGAIDWWINELDLWYKDIEYDGIWIDMSEVASFCVGSCGTGNLTLNPAHPPFELPGEPGNLVLRYPEGFELTNATEASSASSALHTQTQTAGPTSTTTSYFRSTPTPGVRNIDWPPYAINNYHGDIGVHAMSPNATSHGGYLQYDFHNLFGHQILNATYQALLKVFPGKRPFIIGRSTFAGSGKWAGHWGGDNESLWAFMFFSIPQALSFSIFGIPMFGPDTCGFNGNTDYELCSRWMQLSAFFPFYRNHNALSADSQEPYVWSSVIDATKTAMNIRFELLPYMYTLMTLASLKGDTVMRALSWEFPNEPWLADADRQFLLGGGVLVTPCLEQGASTVDGVFPGIGKGGEIWYDWYNWTEVAGPHVTSITPGQNVTIDAPLGTIPVYQRGGYIIATQDPAMTTTESRKKPWGLRVPLDARGKAAGQLYLDDGVSLEPENVTWVNIVATEKSIFALAEGNYVDTNPLRYVAVFGLLEEPKKVFLNGKGLGQEHWEYKSSRKSLSLFGLEGFFEGGVWRGKLEVTWE